MEAVSLSRRTVASQQIHDENAKSMVLDPHPGTIYAVYSCQEEPTSKKSSLRNLIILYQVKLHVTIQSAN